MTYADPQSMTFDRQPLQKRLSSFLESKYPGPNRDARLAQDIGCDPRSARNYFLGHWPSADRLSAIIRRFEDDIWHAVLSPDADSEAARLQAEIEELEGQLAAKKARRQRLASGPKGLARTPDRVR
jgi:hypothetical protein